MTYSLKHKLNIICYGTGLLLFLIIYKFLVNYIFAHVDRISWSMLISFAFLGIFYIPLLVSFRMRRNITLTPDEYDKPLEKELDCSNAIDWFYIMASTVLIVVIFAFSMPTLKDYHTWGLIVCSIAALLIIAPIHSKNKYIIQDDMLIVEEYNYKWQVASLRIPIDTIDRVYIKGIPMPMPAVVLVIDGVERELRCNMHYLELATELTRRINKTR